MKDANSNGVESAGNKKTIWVYTPSRTDPEDLEFILVQRQQVLQDAVDRVKESSLTNHKHHLLFVGPRGCGKTHLVTLIVNRLSKDIELTERLRIAWLNEDETCTELLELLVKIHLALAKRYPNEYRDDMLTTAYDMPHDAALDFVAKQLLSSLGSKTLLVVTENLDAIFDGLGEEGQKQLRSFIQENPKLSIVATAQRLVEDLSKRTSPFFGFFQTEHLKPLNVIEATELLQNIASLQGKQSVVEFLSTSRGRSRVRALHHLSGGNHRIYIVLSQFITRDSIDILLNLFMKMVDELTPYYQERVRWLPPLQRKIVEYLCSSESTVPVKEIAKKLFATPQTISSQLQDLREKGYVEANQRGRESLYEMSEPLMRICVEVKDVQRHQPLRLLVDFLRVWYDDCELQDRLVKLQPASVSCAYLKAAILRNRVEGNLRKQLFLRDLELSLPKKLNTELRESLMRECADLPEAGLLALESVAKGENIEAIACLDEAIAQQSRSQDLADLLHLRAQLYSANKSYSEAISDYTKIIKISDIPVKLTALALISRGIISGRIGERQREVEDYSAVIELVAVPPDLVAKALLFRGLTMGETGEVEREIKDYTAVIELPGASVDDVAKALLNRGITLRAAQKKELALEDYTSVIELSGARAEQVAKALIGRGSLLGNMGRMQLEIDDYTTVIQLAGASGRQVSEAFLFRGMTFLTSNQTSFAIEDLTAVIGSSNSSADQVADASICRGFALVEMGKLDDAIEDFTTVIGHSDMPAEKIAAALVYRGRALAESGEMQRAIEDSTRVIGLFGAPVDRIAQAFLFRGMAYAQMDDTQRAIADYASVIELSGAPIDQMALALYLRGVMLFKAKREQESKLDFDTLIGLPDAPITTKVDAYFALSELHFSEGKWTEGFETLERGLEFGSTAKPVYLGSMVDLIDVLFSAGLNPRDRNNKVDNLIIIYRKYQALVSLGEAAVQHVGNIFRAGEPFPSTDNLEQWASAWDQAAESVPEFGLSARLVRTAINFLKTGGNDRGVLLDLTSTERAILEQAFGFGEKSVNS